MCWCKRCKRTFGWLRWCVRVCATSVRALWWGAHRSRFSCLSGVFVLRFVRANTVWQFEYELRWMYRHIIPSTSRPFLPCTDNAVHTGNAAMHECRKSSVSLCVQSQERVLRRCPHAILMRGRWDMLAVVSAALICLSCRISGIHLLLSCL